MFSCKKILFLLLSDFFHTRTGDAVVDRPEWRHCPCPGRAAGSGASSKPADLLPSSESPGLVRAASAFRLWILAESVRDVPPRFRRPIFLVCTPSAPDAIRYGATDSLFLPVSAAPFDGQLRRQWQCRLTTVGARTLWGHAHGQPRPYEVSTFIKKHINSIQNTTQ